MKLMTDKTLIVFYRKGLNEHYFCTISFFEKHFNNEHSLPILYTSSTKVARNTTERLNKELWA